jgi:hypothetical protein
MVSRVELTAGMNELNSGKKAVTDMLPEILWGKGLAGSRLCQGGRTAEAVLCSRGDAVARWREFLFSLRGSSVWNERERVELGEALDEG